MRWSIVAGAGGAIFGGSITIGAGWGTLSTVWGGLVCTVSGLVLYLVAVPRSIPVWHGSQARSHSAVES